MTELLFNEPSTTQKITGWQEFVQPESLANSSDESYRAIVSALDLGWQVEEPIYLRPRWGEAGPWMFHFILTQKSVTRPCLISTRQSPKIERLILEEGWRVDRYDR